MIVEELVEWANRRASWLPDRLREHTFDGFIDRALADLPRVLESPGVRHYRWRQAKLDAIRAVQNSRVSFVEFADRALIEPDYLEREELHAALNRGVSALTPAQADVARLFLDGADMDEVCTHIRGPRARVRLRLWRALRNLSEVPAIQRLAQ